MPDAMKFKEKDKLPPFAQIVFGLVTNHHFLLATVKSKSTEQ